VWLGTEQPNGRVEAALNAWAASHGVTLQAPRTEADDRGEAASEVAERCDHALDEARDQVTAGDDSTARLTLARVEQTLRQHPELLQASWLMAERYRLEAQIAERASEGGATWQARADVLEGPRAAPFGEKRPALAPAVELPITIAVRGARQHENYWDGSKAGDQFSTAAGEHHLVVLRGKRVAWSGWVSVLVAGTVDIWVPDAPACSAADLGGAAFVDETQVRVPKGVRCGAWAVASLGTQHGTVRAALCHLDACDAASTSAYDIFESKASSKEKPPAKGTFPAWATWTLAGVGLAGATTIILWQAGVFDRATPAQKVIYDGSHL
jgi:hypothetical protein